MIGLLKSIEKWLDVRLAYFLFNGNKQQRYQQYLNKKYLETATADTSVQESLNYCVPIKVGV
jgi:hypothetical protein